MRLINAKTLLFDQFENQKLQQRQRRYAIVSHCWGEVKDEVTYQDFLDQSSRESKPGWTKVEEACRIAHNRNVDWVWIDTCCINKESSAELTEAINSMFAWYRDSKECYAFMSDVKGKGAEGNFVKSNWFLRGWTLQELLAPWSVIFYDQDYTYIGTKASLAKEINEATGIESRFLDPWEDIHGASVAQRMSWAARRRTTKPEDMAYSLLGIFGINMSLLYGEGDHAFLRLQLKIIKNYDDDSIFAWPKTSGIERHEDESCGMLAPNPAAFKKCCTVFVMREKSHLPYSFTSRGVQLKVPRRWSDESHNISFISSSGTEITVELDCEERRESRPARLSIVLRRSHRTGLWYRYGCEIRAPRSLAFARLSGYSTIYVPQPELGQVIRRSAEQRQTVLREAMLSLRRLILRSALVCCGLLACCYMQVRSGREVNPIMQASMNLFTWGLWTTIWHGMGLSSTFLLELTCAGALICATSWALQEVAH